VLIILSFIDDAKLARSNNEKNNHD